jgi:hypothetical protein
MLSPTSTLAEPLPVDDTFADYASAFAGVAAIARQRALSAQQWTELLTTVLVPRLNKAVTVSPARTLWKGELAKVQAVIAALEAGVNPSTNVELLTIPAASASWLQIARATTY